MDAASSVNVRSVHDEDVRSIAHGDTSENENMVARLAADVDHVNLPNVHVIVHGVGRSSGSTTVESNAAVSLAGQHLVQSVVNTVKSRNISTNAVSVVNVEDAKRLRVQNVNATGDTFENITDMAVAKCVDANHAVLQDVLVVATGDSRDDLSMAV